MTKARVNAEGRVLSADGLPSLACQYRLRGDTEWTTHTIVADRPGSADSWRQQVVPVLRRRYLGGVETQVVPI